MQNLYKNKAIENIKVAEMDDDLKPEYGFDYSMSKPNKYAQKFNCYFH